MCSPWIVSWLEPLLMSRPPHVYYERIQLKFCCSYVAACYSLKHELDTHLISIYPTKYEVLRTKTGRDKLWLTLGDAVPSQVLHEMQGRCYTAESQTLNYRHAIHLLYVLHQTPRVYCRIDCYNIDMRKFLVLTSRRFLHSCDYYCVKLIAIWHFWCPYLHYTNVYEVP